MQQGIYVELRPRGSQGEPSERQDLCLRVLRERLFAEIVSDRAQALDSPDTEDRAEAASVRALQQELRLGVQSS